MLWMLLQRRGSDSWGSCDHMCVVWESVGTGFVCILGVNKTWLCEHMCVYIRDKKYIHKRQNTTQQHTYKHTHYTARRCRRTEEQNRER